MSIDQLSLEWERRRRSVLELAKDQLSEVLYSWPTIHQIQIPYSGSGDDGSLGEILFLGADGEEVQITPDTRLMVAADALVFALLPMGWEIDQGSSGTFYYDVASGRPRIDHSWRTIEDMGEEF